ncbi:hypothetical protein JN01_0513 [Entomoplasma freundtii]|uniref:Malate permease n=1 Tax=Entomoplasma freundtii TaxID=74700 RepID=A0A2K8NRC1_9MOLU|nr:AEC family transporter [Entomoplasma freundtii]ATZ16086.1 malate permease [Entomoplasma freundtii]TDY57012.1 hypothetical protein JN01_0513 [Entomoplasma freundtii]
MLLSSSVADALKETLGSWGIWSAIFATIFVIGLGYFLAVKKIFKQGFEKVLIKAVMVVGLPALALNGFLSETSVEKVTQEIVVLLVGFIFYLAMTFGAKVFFLKYEKDIQDTLAMCTAFASTTFFGIPIVTALYGNDASITSNIFNIPYRVFLYSLAFLIMSNKPMVATVVNKKKQKIKKTELSTEAIKQQKELRIKTLKNIFANPILIATFIGFVIWVTQLIPGIKCVSYGKEYFSPLRIDLLFPPIAKVLTTLQAICTPLAWLAIGMTMNNGNLKEAAKSKTLWYATFIKVIVAPLIILVIMILAGLIGWSSGLFKLTAIQLAVVVIMTAAPPASVVVSYAIAYDKGALIASNLTTLSTLVSIITLPIWVVIVTAIGALPIFG